MRSEEARCPLNADEQAELLLDYCAGRMEAPAASLMEAHLEVCPDCRELHEAQLRVNQALESWDAEFDTAAFDRRLRERLAEENRPGWLERVRGWGVGISWKPAIPVMAGLAIWAVLYTPPGPAPRLDASLMKTDLAKAEHVERVLEDVDMLSDLKLTAR
jgi:anti-sigma factor RsiW